MLRKAFALVVLLALLASVAPTLAQEGTLGLSDADFALYVQGNSYEFESLAFDYTFTMSIDKETLTFTGSGVSRVTADGDFTMQTTLTGGGMADIEGTGMPQMVNADAELRLVDNMLYLLDKTSDQGWVAISLEDFLGEDVLGALSGDTLPVDPEALSGGGLGDVSGLGGLEDISGMLGLGSLFDFDPTGFFKLTRLADTTVNGRNTALFRLTLDFGAVLQSDFLKDILAGTGQLSGTPEEIDQQFQFFSAFLGSFLQNLTFTFDQYIATETPRVERGTFTLSLTIPAMTQDATETSINLSLDVVMTAYDLPVNVEAPANFTLVDPEELTSEMGMGGF